MLFNLYFYEHLTPGEFFKLPPGERDLLEAFLDRKLELESERQRSRRRPRR